MSDNDNSLSNIITGLVLGAIVGAGFYYFFTQTEEGKKVKRIVKDKGEDLLDELTEIVEDIENKGEQFKERVQLAQSQLEEKVGDIKKEVCEEAKEGLSQIDQLRERGRRAAKFFLRKGKSLA